MYDVIPNIGLPTSEPMKSSCHNSCGIVIPTAAIDAKIGFPVQTAITPKNKATSQK